MERHAYLIIAHSDFSTLKILLSCLDHANNDIYLHIDKRTKNVPWDDLTSSVQKSKLVIIERISVRWGEYSLIDCELRLLKEAMNNGSYAYYHLLSGSDLPLKSQDEIHRFFALNKGKEFISFVDDELIKSRNCYERIKYYSLFQGYSKHKSKFIRYSYEVYNAISIHLQMLLHIDRIRKANVKLAFGAQWFSITDKLAHYVVEHEPWIKERFSYTRCGDEMFLQMLVIESRFYQNVYQKEFKHTFSDPAMRRIDWERGNPYVFKKEDKDDLINSECLFARKFSSNIDQEIIDEICDYVKETAL